MKVNKSWNGSKKWKCAASIESVEVTEIRKEKGKSIKSVAKNKIPRFTATRLTRGKTHAHTNYDDLMQTTIFHKVFLIMYSDLRRV